MKLKYNPVEVHFHVTRGCNNSCFFCYAESGEKHVTCGQELTLDELKRVSSEFSQLKSPLLFGGVVVYNGGEPTLRYPTIIEHMNFCNANFKEKPHLRMITNGGMLGAQGNYREANRELLTRAGLYEITPAEAIRRLDEQGLDWILISVDATHTTLTHEAGKVPIDSLNNCIGLFLERGYGISPDKQISFNVVYSEEDRDETNRILEIIAQQHNLTRRNKSYHQEGRVITVREYEVHNTGNIFGRKTTKKRTLEELFSFQCRKRSKPTIGEELFEMYWQDSLDIDWDGRVYICSQRTIPIGNIREDSLTEILRRLHAREDHPKYGTAIEIVHIFQELSSYRTWDNRCVGECLRLIHAVRPDLVEQIQRDIEACYKLGRDREMQEILIEEFHKHRAEVLERIAAIDEQTREKRRLV